MAGYRNGVPIKMRIVLSLNHKDHGDHKDQNIFSSSVIFVVSVVNSFFIVRIASSCPRFLTCSDRAESFTEKCKLRNSKNITPKMKSVVVGSTAPIKPLTQRMASYQRTKT